MEQRTFTTARVVQGNGGTNQFRQQAAQTAGTTTQTIARGFPPELLKLIDHDPRFAIQTLDGRWLDPYTGEAVDLLKDLRTTALKRMSQRSDWRQRQLLGMNELAVRKHFFDLEQVIPVDDRLRIVDAATGYWINPYANRAEGELRVSPETILEPETRLTMARLLARTPEMRNPIHELTSLLRPGRRVLVIPDAGPSTNAFSPQPPAPMPTPSQQSMTPADWRLLYFAKSPKYLAGILAFLLNPVARWGVISMKFTLKFWQVIGGFGGCQRSWHAGCPSRHRIN